MTRNRPTVRAAAHRGASYAFFSLLTYYDINATGSSKRNKGILAQHNDVLNGQPNKSFINTYVGGSMR